MKRKQSIYVSEIGGLENISYDHLSSVLRNGYSDSRGYGFQNLLAEETWIQGSLLYKTIASQKVFDEKSQVFRTSNFKVFNEVPFKIDFAKQLIISYVGGSKFKKLLSILGLLFKPQISLDPFYINLKTFVQLAERKNISFFIEKFSVRNYQPQAGVIGNFIGHASKFSLAKDIVIKYEHDVGEIQLEIFEPIEFTCLINSKGKFSYYCDEELDDSVLNYLLELALENRDA